MKEELEEKVEILRKYETLCYQITYYLLQDESLAVRAAGEALLELGLDDEFFSALEQDRENKVRRTAILKSLALK